MEEHFLYRQIAEDIRQEILNGRLQPGDRLPSIREMMKRWKCTPGTVQRAYRELSDQELVTSRPGQGTHVSRRMDPARLHSQSMLRQARMIHQAEEFLLEAITAGYEPGEVLDAVNLALDRWRVLNMVAAEDENDVKETLVFYGSHDLALIWVSNHMKAISPGLNIELNFTGSLGGLLGLAEGRANMAGAHLLDAETGEYNTPFVRRLFPGQRMLLVRLVDRSLGLILPQGNPQNIQSVVDLTRTGIRFANRQAGSGTRVWLDNALRQLNVSPEQIQGYPIQLGTHSEAARQVADGAADVVIGLESAAQAFDLAFVPLLQEPYDLVFHAGTAEQPPVRRLLDWIASPQGKKDLARLAGYNTDHSGELRVVE